MTGSDVAETYMTASFKPADMLRRFLTLDELDLFVQTCYQKGAPRGAHVRVRELVVKLSTPEKVSPMQKKMAPLWPYPDAPGAVGYTYGNRLAQLDPRNEGFTESQGVGVDTQPATS